MAKRKTFTCEECGRIFGMAMHLARHAMTHERRAAAPVKDRTVAIAPVGSGRDGLARMLQAARRELQAQRDTIDQRVQALDGALRAMA
jgi:hypothetical protein